MDVQEAVRVAKNWVSEVFKEEHISRLGLEEVVHDKAANVWQVTLGFARNWQGDAEKSQLFGLVPPPRSYKVITVREPTGEVVSMRNRETEK